ncbi:MAG TPA: DUF1217 domain-containing protein [Paracoccus sp. (in: a-proteobacteria)]|jgi:hypothetical protein|nr:DUF1217 domain-containing protein [Paracoccus sp. (in: a-proteobacteria)]
MTYNVQVGNGGYLGWKLLQRTLDTQQSAFSRSTELQRSRDYFTENISTIRSAEDLVSNYKLLSVALRAFGLDDDLNNRFFIRKVLEADPQDKTSLVNRLPDKRYARLNAAFAFWDAPNATTNKLPAETIADMYTTRSFEKNIGQQHQEIELALNAKRELSQIASATVSNDTKWLQIIASKPLRKVFEGAFNLGKSFASLPIDRQLSEFKSRANRMMGSDDVQKISSSQNIETLTKHYLLRTEMTATDVSSPFSIALKLISRTSIPTKS